MTFGHPTQCGKWLEMRRPLANWDRREHDECCQMWHFGITMCLPVKSHYGPHTRSFAPAASLPFPLTQRVSMAASGWEAERRLLIAGMEKLPFNSAWDEARAINYIEPKVEAQR